MKRLKILISAYACEPNCGSEPGVGWNWIKQISKIHECWVITRNNNRSAIETAITLERLEGVHWIYYDLPKWSSYWKKGQRGIHIYYMIWQIAIYYIGRRLEKEESFDIIHHLTFGTYWLPSFLSLIKKPFIWGPVGGGENTPKQAMASYSFKGQLYEYKRNFILTISSYNPFLRMTIKRAKLILVNTEETGNKVKAIGGKNIEVFSHMGVRYLKMIPNIEHDKKSTFRFISIGRLIHWKGFHLGLMAFEHLIKFMPNSEYWVIGEGPERERLEKIAYKRIILNQVQFFGNINHKQVTKKLRQCDVLIHPSLHDSAPAVCLEAMAAGKPVICLDIGGPAMQITEKTGFKISFRNVEQVVQDIAKAMSILANDAKMYNSMRVESQSRIRKYYYWDKKLDFILEYYEKVIKL